MEFFHIVILAIAQGVTEFLPISSSAHLILFPQLLHWPDQGLAFDVAVHVGTLVAVVAYFQLEIRRMLHAWVESIRTRTQTRDSHLAWAVLLSVVPVVFAGVLFHRIVEQGLRSPFVIASATVFFALLLWWADAQGRGERNEYSIKFSDALFIGIAQVLALIPGTSRSGITITAGLMLGLKRASAARFSFLLSIPTIAGAGVFEVAKLVKDVTPVNWNELFLGSLLSALAAYACIHYFLRLIERVGMLPFVLYRVFLGLWLLIIFY